MSYLAVRARYPRLSMAISFTCVPALVILGLQFATPVWPYSPALLGGLLALVGGFTARFITLAIARQLDHA